MEGPYEELQSQKQNRTTKASFIPPSATPAQATDASRLLERKGPYRNLIEIPGMKGRTLERVEIYTATGHHSLTLDFEDQTSLSLLLDPCLFITAELSDISSGNERQLKRWPKIKSITGNE